MGFPTVDTALGKLANLGRQESLGLLSSLGFVGNLGAFASPSSNEFILLESDDKILLDYDSAFLLKES